MIDDLLSIIIIFSSLQSNKKKSHTLFLFQRVTIGGTWNISNLPIVIGSNLDLGSESVTVITPTSNSTIFIVVDGTASIDGTLVLDLSGRNYTSTYTTLAVVRAGEIQGGFQSIQVGNAPKR